MFIKKKKACKVKWGLESQWKACLDWDFYKSLVDLAWSIDYKRHSIKD